MDIKGNLRAKGDHITITTSDKEVATQEYVQLQLSSAVGGGFYGVIFQETDGNPPPYKADTLFFDSSAFYLNSNSQGKPIVSLRGSAGTGISSVSQDPTPTLGGNLNANSFRITGLTDPTSAQDGATKNYVDTNRSPGFYGVNFQESDGNPPAFRNDTLVFNSTDFYLRTNSKGKPVVSSRGSGSGTALTVKEIDGAPSVSSVNTIRVTNGTLTDDGGGQVTIVIGSGSGVSVKDGVHTIANATTLNFNDKHFYLSQQADGSPVINLRYDLDIIPAFVELPTIQNVVLDSFAAYPYSVQRVDADCKSGSCTIGFYILSSTGRNKNGISITGLDPISVSTSPITSLATALNALTPGDALLMSIPTNSTAKHLRISVTARAPN